MKAIAAAMGVVVQAKTTNKAVPVEQNGVVVGRIGMVGLCDQDGDAVPVEQAGVVVGQIDKVGHIGEQDVVCPTNTRVLPFFPGTNPPVAVTPPRSRNKKNNDSLSADGGNEQAAKRGRRR